MKNQNSKNNAQPVKGTVITIVACAAIVAAATAIVNFAENKNSVQAESKTSIADTAKTTAEYANETDSPTALDGEECEGEEDDEWTEMEYPGLASAKIEFKGKAVSILSDFSDYSSGFEPSQETLGAGELTSAFTENLEYEISIFNTSDKEQKIDDCVICGIASHYPDAVDLSVNGIRVGSTRADVEKAFSGLKITFEEKGLVELSDGYFHVNIYFMDNDDIVDNISVNDFSVWFD